MFTKRNNFLSCLLAVVLVAGVSPFLTAQNKDPLTIQLSSGLIVSMTPREGWSFIQAELIIPIHDSEMNPIIPRLTGENLFDRTLLDNETSLTNGLTRLGGDFRIDHRPTEIRLSIYFPSDQIRDFASLLQDLFTYKTFSLKRFDFSRLNFFERFRSEADWPFQIARAIAYSQFFPDHPSARGPVQRSHLEHLNLSYIRSFYSRIFKPERALLVMNGGLNPHTTYGLIEMTMKDLRKPQGTFPPRTVPFPRPREQNRIICLESDRFSQLGATLFSVLPPVHTLEHFQERILHTHLFSVPHGRIFNQASRQKLLPVDFYTRLYNHSNLSVMATEFITTQHLDRLLDLMGSELRRMQLRPFDEREYLVASNILLGQMKVQTARYRYSVDLRLHPILSNQAVPYLENPGQLLVKNNFARSVQYLSRKTSQRQNLSLLSPELIIVTGNAHQLNQFKSKLSPALRRQTTTIPLQLD